MKITDVETFIAGNPWKNWLFTRVHTDEGVYGVGEGTVNFMAKTVESAIHELRPQWEGQDPFQPERIVQRMYRDVYTDGGQIHKHAVAAVEVACWDIMGKCLNKPVYQLLGRPDARQDQGLCERLVSGPADAGELSREGARRGPPRVHGT